jgi:hypothetical protein
VEEKERKTVMLNTNFLVGMKNGKVASDEIYPVL